jgi:hypothetical protein
MANVAATDSKMFNFQPVTNVTILKIFSMKKIGDDFDSK